MNSALQRARAAADAGLPDHTQQSALRAWLVTDPLTQRWRHIPTRANGQLAVDCYMYSAESGRYEAGVLDVLTLSAGSAAGSGAKISAVTAFVLTDDSDAAETFARFGLPAWQP